MIKEALKFLLTELNLAVDSPAAGDDTVVLGNIALLDTFNDTTSQTLLNKVVASVVNISEESTLRNLPRHKPGLNGLGQPVAIEQQPAVYLNVYVLFGANFTNNYENALAYISNIIGFFQQKNVFDTSADPVLSLQVQKLVMDLYSMNLEELNQLWGILGGKYVPSVLYKMRMAVIQRSDPAENTGVVQSIEFNANAS